MLNKKFLSLVLAILMVVSMIPFAAVTAFAESETLPESGNYAFTADSWNCGSLSTSDGTSMTMSSYKASGTGYAFTSSAGSTVTTVNTFDLSGGFILSFDLSMLKSEASAYYGPRFYVQIGDAFTFNVQGLHSIDLKAVHYSIGAGAATNLDKTYGTTFATTRYGDYNTGINFISKVPSAEEFAVTNTTFTIKYENGEVSVYSDFMKSDSNPTGVITWTAGTGDAGGASSFAIAGDSFKDVKITMAAIANFVTMDTKYLKNITLRGIGEGCTHINMTEETTVEPTCTETGILTRTCSDCGAYTETRAIDALGHVQGEKVSTTATCTESGYATYTCSRCGENFQVAEAAHGHTDLGERVTVDGYTYKVCDVCRVQYDGQIKIDAGAYYEFTASSWKVSGDSQYTGTISEDGTTVTIPLRTDGKNGTPKTVTLEDGSTFISYYDQNTRLKSVDCYDLTDGFTFSFDMYMLGRAGSNWNSVHTFSVGNITLQITLTAGSVYNFELKNGSTSLGKFSYNHGGYNGVTNSSDAQCRTQEACDYINTTYTFEYKNGNFTLYMDSLKSAENPTGAVIWSNGKSSFEVDSTIFECAYIDLNKAYTWVEQPVIYSNISLYGAGEACTHEETTVVRTTEPTCTETGVDTTRCANCGKTLGTTSVAALGHSWGEWETTKAPTCKTPGTDTRTCTTCNETETRAIETTDHVAGTTYVKHTDGNYYLTCKDCGTVILTEKLEAPKFEGVQEGTADGLLSVRFVGTIDTTVYTKIGFEISAPDYEKNWTTSSSTVYTKIVGSTDTGVVTEYTAESFGASYIYAATITGVPVTGTVVFNVTSYAEFNGDKITGDTYTVTYTNGEFVSIDPVV